LKESVEAEFGQIERPYESIEPVQSVWNVRELCYKFREY
jgi:hypothetical protein